MKNSWAKKIISCVTLAAFLLTGVAPSYAQMVLPAPGTLVGLSQQFQPAAMTGVQVDLKDPFRLNFLIKRGEKALEDGSKREEYNRLIKYFLASLTIPNDEMWVNLSPYESGRMIPDDFGKTDMGRDLLAQDYILKQITASLIYPENEAGKAFWAKVYAAAYEKYGTTDVPIDTFNKVWIIPDKAVIYEKYDTAVIVESHLKVMLETDYMAMEKNAMPTRGHVPQNVSPSTLPTNEPLNTKASQGNPIGDTIITKDILRSVILPILEKEINEGSNFALLRQIYSAMTMATWFKRTLRQSLLGRVYADKAKVNGVELNDPGAKEKIYQQYLEAYRKGVFNFIKEEHDLGSDEVIPRKYFSGGIQALSLDMAQVIHDVSEMTPGQKANFDAAEDSDRVVTRLNKFKEALGRSEKLSAGLEATRSGPADAQSAEQIATLLAGDEDIRKTSESTSYTDPVLGEFVDLDHFVFAQKKLSETGAYDDILSKTGFNKETVDKLIGFDPQTGQSTYEDPRLNVTFFDQSGNPRLRGITEAVSNGLDALYAGIGVNMMRGQFSKGVKQIIDWLEPNGQDRVEVYSYKDGAKTAYKLTILRASQGSFFIQVKEVGFKEFQAMGRDAMGKDISHGTVLKLIVQKAIVETESQLDQEHHDSIEGLANGIKASSAFVRHFKVMLQAADGDPEKLNGFTPIVAPEADGIIDGDGEVFVRLASHEITIMDNGIGMDGRIISRMFAPGLGNKDPKFLNDQEQEEELKHIIIGYKKGQASRTVSFGRRGETLRTVTIGDDVHPDAVVSGVGGLMIDLGLLVSAQESREDFNLTPAFAKGMVNAVQRILALTEIEGVSATDQEKIRIVNAMMLGLDGLRRGNVENERLVNYIFGKVQGLVAPLIDRLKEQGYVALPHYKDFEKISLPEGKKPFFVHAKLFVWNAETLKDVGAQVIPGIKVPGNIPLLVLPFTTEALQGVSKFSLDWHNWEQGRRVPIIKTDRFIAVPQEFGESFRVLAEKRLNAGLDAQEEKEFFAWTQILQIITADEGVTSYEITAPVRGLVVETAPVQRKTHVNEKEKKGLGKLLAVPPVQARGPEQHASVPSDAHMKWALLADGHVVEIGTGEEPIHILKDIVKLEPLAYGYYQLIDVEQNTYIFEENTYIFNEDHLHIPSLSSRKDQNERIIVSPNKKFACKMGSNGELLAFLDLENKQDKTKDMLISLVGDDSNYAFSEFKISRDGKSMFVVIKKLQTGERGGYILNFQTGMKRGVFVFDGKDEVIGLDPFSDLVVIKQGNGQYFVVDMVRPSVQFKSVEYMRTSADGAYTVMINKNGTMVVYAHRTGAIRFFSSGELFGISFIYGHKGDVKVLATGAVEGSPSYLFEGDSWHVLDTDSYPSQEALMTEFISSETKDVLIRSNDKKPWFDAVLEPLSDGQEMTDPRVYKHPVFDLFINKTDPVKIVATSLVTGAQLEVDGDVISFGRDERGVEFLMSSTSVIYGGQGDEGLRRFSMKATDGRPDGFSIIGGNGKYELISNSNFSRNSLETVSWDKYEQIDFDGKYFVFTDPDNGDALYLDPVAPDDLITVSAQAQPQSSEVPDDGNMKFDLDKNGNIVQIGTGRVVEETSDYRVLRPLINNYYEHTYQDGHKGVMRFGENEQKKIFFEPIPLLTSRSFSTSPLDRFVYQLEDEDCSILDLRTGKSHRMKGVIHQRDFEDFMVKASKPGQKFRYSDLQFSDNESFLFVVSTDLFTKEKRGHLVDTKTWVNVPLTGAVHGGIELSEMTQIAWNQQVGAFIIKDAKTGMGYLLEPERGETWGPVKHLRMSSSGRYGVGINKEGAMEIYGESRMLLKPEDVGNEEDRMLLELEGVDNVRFVHGNEEKIEDIVVRHHDGRWGVIAGGRIVYDENKVNDVLKKAFFWEEYMFDGFGFRGVGDKLFADEDFDGDAALPRVYKHPDADYLIDRSDPASPVGVSLRTGNKVHFNGEIFFLKASGHDGPFVFSRNDGKYYYHAGGGESFFGEELPGSVMAGHGESIVFKGGGGYRWCLNDENEPVQELKDIDVSKYTKVIYSSPYFVFIDPLTQAAVYLNAGTKSRVFVSNDAGVRQGVPSAREQKILDAWDEKVVSRVDAWMAQVRNKKDALLQIMPDDQMQIWLDRLDWLQDHVIRERFQSYVEKGLPEDGLDLSKLPFDVFSAKVDMLLPVLKDYLPGLEVRLVSSPYEVQQDTMDHFWEEIQSFLFNEKIRDGHVDEDFLDTLAAGWVVEDQEFIDAIPFIIELRLALKKAEANLTFAEERKIISFLGEFASAHQDAVEIVKAQVRRLLDVRPDEGYPYVKAMIKSFEKVNIEDLQKYARNLRGNDLPGEARSFSVFLTNKNAKHVPEADRYDPKGIEMLASGSKITISQIMRLWQGMVKEKGTAPVMSPEDLARAVEQGLLPPMAEEEQKAELKLINDILNQAEPVAHTREIVQNSRDAIRNALRKGSLALRCYISGKEFVEEYQDDGSGAEYPMALVMPVSTKAAGAQEAFTGFFGAGNLTILRDADRVEKITRHGDDAYMFTFTVERDTAGNPQGFFITGIRKLDDPTVVEGVTIRRIKSMVHSIPEIDRMVVERGIQTFAGLAQSEDFVIKIQNEKGEFEPLTVKAEILSQVDFKGREKGRYAPKDFGKLKVWQTEDMPSQIVDGTGLRIGEIEEEYLELVPKLLRRHIKELGIVLQIPLPLTRSRGDIEYVHDHLWDIQKHVAIAFYQALSYKTLIETSPQFNFEGYPSEVETNGSKTYWSNLTDDKRMLNLASRISNSGSENVTFEELELLKTSSADLFKKKDFVNLLLMIQVATDRSVPDKKESVLDRKRAILKKINPAEAENIRRKLEAEGNYRPSEEVNVPYMERKVQMGRGISRAMDQMKDPQDFVVEVKNDAERELVHFAWLAGGLLGIQQVLLVNEKVSFAGAFKMHQGKPTMFINRSLANRVVQLDGGSRGIIDEGTDTVIHELAHLLEHYMQYGGDMEAFWKQGFVSMPDDVEKYTHQSRGLFTEAMRYVAGIFAMILSERGFVGEPVVVDPGDIAQEADSSVTADTAQVSPYGGIDLNERYLDLEVRRDGAGMPLSFDQQPAELTDITGLIPEIIEITPADVASMPIFART